MTDGALSEHATLFEDALLAQRPDDEWLLTNGLGGFASGTVSGIPRRRYHAWLIAALAPPVGRMVTLACCAEWLVVANAHGAPTRYDLSTFAFASAPAHPQAKGAKPAATPPPPEVQSPQGVKALRRCVVGQTVQWEYTIASLGVTITRELCLHRLRNACTIRYRVQGSLPEGCYLESRPLFAMRDFHDLAHHDPQSLQLEHDGHNIRVRTSGFACTVHASKLNPAADASPRFVESVDVWKNFAYTFDRERGQDGREHLWSPGTFVSRLRAGAHKHTIALELEARTEADASLTSVRSLPSIEDHIQAETLRLAPMLEAASKGAPKTDQDVLAALVHAADQFVVVRGAGDAAKSQSTQSQSPNGQSLTSIIAGYPWFSDWGRDTMISLPGLLLSCGRFDEAHASLLAFARLRRKGLVPNCFDNGSGEAMYNTADASLWFLIACCRYAQATSDTKGLAELLPACFDVIEAYEGGTDFGIRVDAKDGLVIAGNRDTQLTWMDAKRDGVVFTPRNGKPVELSALWYAGLMGIAKLVESTSVQRARSLRSLADHTARHFEKTFWNDSLQCLFDLAPGEPGVQQYEAAFVRPNQVFATCLPESPLSKAKRAMVLERVHEQLLTPFGLRTLAAGSSGYRPFYEGPLFARDGAYHCGTVWPWLLGPYCEGLMRLNHFSSASRGQARSLLQPLLGELMGEAQLARPRAADQTAPRAAKHEQQTTLRLPVRTIAEVYDAEDVPELGRRRPEGCFAQAWSVAEVLRVLKLADAGEE